MSALLWWRLAAAAAWAEARVRPGRPCKTLVPEGDSSTMIGRHVSQYRIEVPLAKAAWVWSFVRSTRS
jgi:hypothetical protein